MKIKIEDKYSKNISIETLSNFTIRNLSGEDYERGAVEEAQGTADNATKAIGRLCELLIRENCLCLDDVIYIVGADTDKKYSLEK